MTGTKGMTGRYEVSRHKRSRFWALRDGNSGELVAVTVYKKGAMAVKERLEGQEGYGAGSDAETAAETVTDGRSAAPAPLPLEDDGQPEGGAGHAPG
jgi:hypothetical protein